jgi:hypothetical protein
MMQRRFAVVAELADALDSGSSGVVLIGADSTKDTPKAVFYQTIIGSGTGGT